VTSCEFTDHEDPEYEDESGNNVVIHGADIAATEGLLMSGGGNDPVPTPSHRSCLGIGYDVSGEYADSASRKATILDLSKFASKINFESETGTQWVSISGSSAEKYQEDIGVKLNISGTYNKFFSGSLKTKFDSKVESSTSYQFATIQTIIRDNTSYIQERTNPSILQEYLTNTFSSDLHSTMKPKDLFTIYGTHAITGVVIGGRYDYDLSTVKINTSSSIDINAYVQANYNSKISSAKADTDVDVKIAKTSDYTSTKAAASSVGGNKAPADPSDSSYKAWVASINSENKAMVAFLPGGLMPIWKLCSDTARAKVIEDAFVPWLRSAYERNFPSMAPKEAMVGLSVEKGDRGPSFTAGGLTYYRINQDLNERTFIHGTAIYLYVANGLDDGSSGLPLTDIAIVYDAGEQAAKRHMQEDYLLRNVDLNTKALGDYIYLVHRAANGGRPIRNISTVDENRPRTCYPEGHDGYGQDLEAHWAYRMENKGMTTIKADLNKGAGGDYIYLRYYMDKPLP